MLALAYLSLALSLLEVSVRAVTVRVSVGDLLKEKTDGRVILLFAPPGNEPLGNIDAQGPNHFFGKNVYGASSGAIVTLSGGGNATTYDTEVYGYPKVSLDDLPAGSYELQAFMTRYETARRSDGSVVKLPFPCGDGAPQVNGVGSLRTAITSVTVSGDKAQTIDLSFTEITQAEKQSGTEIGSCSQGNYADTPTMKYVKIRSDLLSNFWGRDMYIGANVVLPHGYDEKDSKTNYPVIYAQSHWPGSGGAFYYPYDPSFQQYYDGGFSPDKDGKLTRPVPKFILVTFRHESPYYDDSYGVNSANLGPYGDAINDELIAYIDWKFNTIDKPYGRIQEGGSTGGWTSIASTIFRPDLFGACFSYYPDSLDFHKHQDISLYDNKNAYVDADGNKIGSVRRFRGDQEQVLLTVEQENHWELTFGTSSRANLQWDVWNAVFGVQGLNGYPLEPWNKVTGEIYPDSVAYWKAGEMDLAEYISRNWKGGKNLRAVLKDRIHVSVGMHDNYYLNKGVIKFKERIEGLAGPNWANITVLPNVNHGGYYLNLNIWDYLDLVDAWVKEHAPNGPKALSKRATSKRSRGNYYGDAVASGGHGAAQKRQADPKIHAGKTIKVGQTVRASVGAWDPGMALVAQWMVAGKRIGQPFVVKKGDTVEKKFGKSARNHKVRLLVTGTKPGYETETRKSNAVSVKGKRRN